MSSSIRAVLYRLYLLKAFFVALLIFYSTIGTLAQSRFQFASGLGNMEHFSVSGGLTFSHHGEFYASWGTDVFNEVRNFSSLMLNYQHPVWKKKTGFYTLHAGLKAGWNIYSNEFYRWTAASVVPFLGIGYPVQEGLEMRILAGLALNHELSAERIRWGEAGWYPRYLPELKIEFAYVFPQH